MFFNKMDILFYYLYKVSKIYNFKKTMKNQGENILQPIRKKIYSKHRESGQIILVHWNLR